MQNTPQAPATAISPPESAASHAHAELAKHAVDDTDPASIHQAALDITGHALETGNFELFAAFFHLPHDIETFGGNTTLHSLHDLRVVFDNARAQFEEAGIARRIRDCISASFKDADTILATHVTRVMHGHQQMREPVPCHSVLKRIDGLWKVVRSAYAYEESDKPFDRLLTRNGRMLDFTRP